MNPIKSIVLLSIVGFLITTEVYAQHSFELMEMFPADEAFQAVAVDSSHFYAVATRSIGKYDKSSGDRVDFWEGPVKHLDSGVIVNGKLYAAHSNYPEIPMTSSVEIWNTETLEHIESHSFGIRWGSCTWIDRHDGSWWAVFGHYEEFAEEIGKDNRWTTLVQFSDDWQPLESWVLPPEGLERFDGKSNSGGSWAPTDSSTSPDTTAVNSMPCVCRKWDWYWNWLISFPSQARVRELRGIAQILE